MAFAKNHLELISSERSTTKEALTGVQVYREAAAVTARFLTRRLAELPEDDPLFSADRGGCGSALRSSRGPMRCGLRL